MVLGCDSLFSSTYSRKRSTHLLAKAMICPLSGDTALVACRPHVLRSTSGVALVEYSLFSKSVAARSAVLCRCLSVS